MVKVKNKKIRSKVKEKKRGKGQLRSGKNYQEVNDRNYYESYLRLFKAHVRIFEKKPSFIYIVRPVRGRVEYLWSAGLRLPFFTPKEKVRLYLEKAVAFLFELIGFNQLRRKGELFRMQCQVTGNYLIENTEDGSLSVYFGEDFSHQAQEDDDQVEDYELENLVAEEKNEREREKLLAESRARKYELEAADDDDDGKSGYSSSSPEENSENEAERDRIFNEVDQVDTYGNPVDKLSRVYEITGFKSIRKIITNYQFRVFDQSFRIRFPNTKHRVRDVINVIFVFRSIVDSRQAMKLGVRKFHTVNLS